MASYVSTVLIACCFVICSAKPPGKQQINVNDFATATWNTNGPQWHGVQTLMTYKITDVLALQEAGSTRGLELRPVVPPVPVSYAGIYVSDVGVQQYTWNWNKGSEPLYLYYYDNRVDDPSAPGTSQGTTKQNMAIITRQKADEVVLLPNEVRHNSTTAAAEANRPRTFINRPVLGVLIENRFFFSVHPEPSRASNEAPALVSAVQHYVDTWAPSGSWMAMGDFNRTPAQLRPLLPRARDGRFIKIVHPGVRTRVSGELDYCVAGGPALQNVSMLAHLLPFIDPLGRAFPNPSDHEPVRFSKEGLSRTRFITRR